MEAFMDKNNVECNTSWAGALPVAQGLYDPENEKDSCGVGFIANIKGEYSHRILKDASNILCNMVCDLRSLCHQSPSCSCLDLPAYELGILSFMQS
jgi:hypothetical protein